MTWQITYRVEGTGHFPHDMLRYDSSFPSRETDSNLMDEVLDLRAIQVTHRGALRTWKPTTARWNSFGWEVVDVNLPVKLVA